MRNRGRRSRGSDDINLTPLLDVLFVILFIVMLAGTQTQKDMQENAEESLSKISGLEEQVTDLEEQNTILQSEVNRKDKIEDSGKRYESDAVIVTFINEVEDGNHVLRIYKGSDQEVESFRLGSDRTDYTKSHVIGIINDIGTDYTKSHVIGIINDIVDDYADHPVFIVFHCDTKSIYRKEEFVPIRDALQTQKQLRKEVFYQIVEE